MEIFTKVISRKERPAARALLSIPMETCIKANGRTICTTAVEWKHGITTPAATRVSSLMVERRARVELTSVETITKASFKKERCTDRAHSSSENQAKSIMVNSLTTTSLELVPWPGQMECNTKVNF